MAAVLAAGASIFSVLSAYTVKMYRCGLSPAGGHAPPKPAIPKSVRPCTAPAGNCLPSASPSVLLGLIVGISMLNPAAEAFDSEHALNSALATSHRPCALRPVMAAPELRIRPWYGAS